MRVIERGVQIVQLQRQVRAGAAQAVIVEHLAQFLRGLQRAEAGRLHFLVANGGDLLYGSRSILLHVCANDV